MERPSIVCAVINAIFVLFAAFIFLFYIFHENNGSDAKEMNREEIEKFRHHRRVLPEHFTNISLIEQHYCPAQQADQCSIKAFSFCGNNSRTVSLTFDMDQFWTKDYTDGVIKELEGMDIHATFFITGQESIDHQNKCEQVRSLVEAGHEVQLMNWNGIELHPDQPIEALQIDDAMAFFRDCLGSSRSLPEKFRPTNGQITLDQARAVSQRYHLSIAMWSLSSEPDRVEHVLELSETHLESNESIIIRCHDPEYWSQPGPLSVLVSYFYQEQYKFIMSKRCYHQCSTELCLVPAPRSR